MSLSKIKSILSSGIGAKTALAAVASLDPRLRSFMTAAAAAGYGAQEMFEFLQNQSLGPQEQSRRRNVQSRAASGRATPQEMVEARDIQEQGAPARAVRNLAGLGAGALAAMGTDPRATQMPENQGGGEVIDVQAEQVQETPTGYVKRALDGVEYFDLPDEYKERIAPEVRALYESEQNRTPWEDAGVQRLVKAIRRKMGVRDREAARQGMVVPQQQPQATQQPGSADAMVMQGLQALLDEFRKL